MKLVQRMQWLPFVIYLYPVVAGFLVDSRSHDILGKYSVSWFAFCLLNLTLYPAFLWFHKRASLVGKSAVLSVMCLMTVLAVNNLQIVLSPFMVDTWSLTRGAAGLSLLTICLSLFQLQKYRNTFIVFAVASLLVGSSAADIFMAPERDQIANPDPECENGFANKFLALNDEYLALHPFATGDILIIGDSITGSAGIHASCPKAYPKVLRRLEDTKFTPPNNSHYDYPGRPDSAPYRAAKSTARNSKV